MSMHHRIAKLEKAAGAKPVEPALSLDLITDEELAAIGAVLRGEVGADAQPLFGDLLARHASLQLRGRRIEDVPGAEVRRAFGRLMLQLGPQLDQLTEAMQ